MLDEMIGIRMIPEIVQDKSDAFSWRYNGYKDTRSRAASIDQVTEKRLVEMLRIRGYEGYKGYQKSIDPLTEKRLVPQKRTEY